MGADVVALSEIDVSEFKVIMRAGPEPERGPIGETYNLTKGATVFLVGGVRAPAPATHPCYCA
jgi:hypothetical protein